MGKIESIDPITEHVSTRNMLMQSLITKKSDKRTKLYIYMVDNTNIKYINDWLLDVSQTRIDIGNDCSIMVLLCGASFTTYGPLDMTHDTIKDLHYVMKWSVRDSFIKPQFSSINEIKDIPKDITVPKGFEEYHIKRFTY